MKSESGFSLAMAGCPLDSLSNVLCMYKISKMHFIITHSDAEQSIW